VWGLPRVLGMWEAAGYKNGDVSVDYGLCVVRMLTTATRRVLPTPPGIGLLQFNIWSIICTRNLSTRWFKKHDSRSHTNSHHEFIPQNLRPIPNFFPNPNFPTNCL